MYVSNDHDAEIAQAEHAAAELRPAMAAALERWLDATAPWVVAFWEVSVSRIVERNPDEIQALGDSGRKEVKAATERLIGGARRRLQERLVDERPEAWPHRGPRPSRMKLTSMQALPGPAAASLWP